MLSVAHSTRILGNKVHDGGEAVKTGIAKRGVSSTYVMIEGCDSPLGCTVVLWGASRLALKQVKVLFNFLLNTAYNIRLFCHIYQKILGSSLLVNFWKSHASDILHEKIVSVTSRYNSLKQANESNEVNTLAAQEALTYFPWHARRYLFMLASAWNERLNAIGQALSAMKKLAVNPLGLLRCFT